MFAQSTHSGLFGMTACSKETLWLLASASYMCSSPLSLNISSCDHRTKTRPNKAFHNCSVGLVYQCKNTEFPAKAFKLPCHCRFGTYLLASGDTGSGLPEDVLTGLMAGVSWSSSSVIRFLEIGVVSALGSHALSA